MSGEAYPMLEIDDYLLAQIFPDLPTPATKMLSETGHKSIRVADFKEAVVAFEAETVVVRVGKRERPISFFHVSAFQRLAANILPGLVPKTYRVGKVKGSDGKE